MPEPRRLSPHFRSLATIAASLALVLGLAAPSALAATAPPTPEATATSSPDTSPPTTPNPPTPGPATSAPATPTPSASAPAAPDSTIEIAVTGPLMLLAAEGLRAGTDERIVVVQAPGGALLRLHGIDAATVQSGDEFSGTVALDASIVPEPVPSTAPPSDPDAVVGGDSAEGRSLLAQSVAAELPVVAVESTITPTSELLPDAAFEQRTVAGAVPARAHTLDIAIVGTSTSATNYFSDAQVNALVAEMNSYWASQSQGALARMTRPLSVKRVVVNDPCEPFSVWTAAASAFGVSDLQGSYGAGQGRHLVTLAAPLNRDGCTPGNGLGSVGSSVHEGGLLWAAVAGSDASSVVGHELGHNFGLGHSNTHYCSTPGVVEGLPDANGNYSNGCFDDEYSDYYDIMAGGVSSCGSVCYTTDKLTALNVAHKASLGFLDAASLAHLSLPAADSSASHTVTLQAISSTTGIRGIRLVNPRDGGVYFVELRNGTGIDAGGFYTTPAGGGLGARILRLGSEFGPASRVLAAAGSGSAREHLLDPGESFTTANHGVSIAITDSSPSAITLKVQLTRPVVQRVAGVNRYATAVALSQLGYPGTAPIVYVATGTNFPDALAAAPAAATLGGPLLLTEGGGLPDVVKKEIQRLKPARIVVVGGPTTVSDTVLRQLRALQSNTVRLAGADRYETAKLIIADAFPGTVSETWMATGLNFPDALSAAAVAGSRKIPVALINGAQSTVDGATAAMLAKLKPGTIAITGDTKAISAGIERALKTNYSVARYAGADRFATSEAINATAFTAPKTVYLATGFGFADALAGAAIAGASAGPLYVIPGHCVPGGVVDKINSWGTTRVIVIGGPTTLSPAVEKLTRC